MKTHKGLLLISVFAIILHGCVAINMDSIYPTITSTVIHSTPFPYRPCYPQEDILSESIDYPDFLGRVWPAPGCNITLDDYNKTISSSFHPYRVGVGITVNWKIIDELYPDMELPPVVERVTLYINDTLVTTDTIDVFIEPIATWAEDENGHLFYYEESPGIIFWRPSLGIGVITARVIIESNLGEQYEYTWNFTITE